MNFYKIVTIERQYASGGREVGRMLAEKLGIQFYNEEILNMAAKNLNLPPDYVRNSDESAPSSLIYGLVMAANANNPENNMPLSDRLFFEQSKIIKDLAAGESCVIVGRCAGQILNSRKDCLNVFIYSDFAARVRRAVNEYGVIENEAESVVKKNDKRRANFYNIQSSKKWADMYTYDMCLNSASLGIKSCVEIIAKAFSHTGER